MSSQIALFFIIFNVFAGIVGTMGVAAELGLSVETGNPSQLERATDQREPDLGASSGSTLFGMYNSLSDQLGTMFYSIAPGFDMLRNFLPGVFVDGMYGVASFIISKDLIAFARGTDL